MLPACMSATRQCMPPADIQRIKANARGFRDFTNYRARILFHCGKLDLAMTWEKLTVNSTKVRFFRCHPMPAQAGRCHEA